MILSIITINRNNSDGLRKTMESVFAQTYHDFEYIVIDGASTDGSVDVIKEFAACPVTHNPSPLTFTWTSEKDNGIYDAMNRGVRKAHGEYVLMLNSGDYLVDEYVIEGVLPELDGTDIIQGNVITIRKGQEVINRGYGHSDISFFEAMDAHFLHQASFIKRTLHDVYGLYDESYKKNADTYFYIKTLALGNATFRYIDQNISYFDMSGISNDPKWRLCDREEDARFYRENIPIRMLEHWKKGPNKIQLYDKLHAYKWSWNLTMVVAHLVNFFHRNK